MTSFAFIAGLLPLVVATGAGAIGNRTIGGTAAGGMLLGTVFGVLVIPGLYYIFGKLADGRKFLQHETDRPLSEVPEFHGVHDHAHPPPDDDEPIVQLTPHPPPPDTGPPPAGGHH
jgi:HAE1 family hydrophobic/amphiphilic exporter-1